MRRLQPIISVVMGLMMSKKRIGARTIYFGRRLSSEAKAERLTAEVQRLSRLHGDDVEAIRRELRPFADQIGLELAMPRSEVTNYCRCADGTYQVVRHVGGKALTLARGIQAEPQAIRLAQEVQRLAPLYGEDLLSLCKELEPLADEFGIKIAIPQEKSGSSKEHYGVVDRSQSVVAKTEFSEPAVEALNYSQADDGTYSVFKTLAGRRVDFAVNVPTIAKAEQLAQEIEFLVQLHGADVASICEELKIIADELDVKLVAYEDQIA